MSENTLEALDRATLKSALGDLNGHEFERTALALFHYQYKHNPIYQQWVNNLRISPQQVVSLDTIPFLPIEAFKMHKLHNERTREETVFLSSGTTGAVPSKHYVFDLALYLDNCERIFESFYGRVESYCFLGLLPSYLERSGSSLVAMVDHFIKKSRYAQSGFFLYDHKNLHRILLQCKSEGVPTVLFGVSYALLDFAAAYDIDFPALIVLETGGMKGRKKEVTREVLHKELRNGFGVHQIHSEYGMTELFSQAYSRGKGVFSTGDAMTILIKDPTDPLSTVANGKSGVINIVDLANIDSCAFIETQDLGRKFDDGSFEILGRMDRSDVRGCNLMVGDV